MLFDTGSSMVYMLTDKCDKDLCPQEQKFEQFNSGSFKEQSKEETAHCYGKGCVNGYVSRDDICFQKDAKERSSCVSGATFLAVKEATDIEKDQFSGIVGLSPQSDVAALPAFIQQASGIGNSVNDVSPVFSFYLPNKEDQKGSLSIGGYNTQKFA